MQNLIFKWHCQGLFSANYLSTRFIYTDKYKQLTPPKELRNKISELINTNLKTVTNKNESQLEEDLIRPILRELKIHYIVRVDISRQSPDYAIFESEEKRAEADRKSSQRYEGAVALVDAKRWGRDFDKRSGSATLDNNPNAIPCKQIANYISETGIEWGILTTGQKWRLYNRNVTPVSQSYFEIDLQNAILDEDLFHLFYSLFSGASFAKEAQDFVLKKSKSLWSAIGDDLKERAYLALEELCNGFYTLKPEANINDIYEGSLILLYRLLFVLNAESRGLFPVNNTSYSFSSIKKILEKAKSVEPKHLSAKLPTLYLLLKSLFDLINEGDTSIGIYQYNGGLFKDEGLFFLPENFFNEYKIPDRYMANALSLIALSSPKRSESPTMVDFSELDVRHLGSIYEGLLEFHPILKDDKIVLFTDKGERKISGSYYTPDYVVNYIVENSLAPLTKDMKTPQEVLELKIIDPAMGSGHFLVGAIDYIGKRCLELAGAESELEEKDYQRLAVEKCIYGIDLNPLAVELTKLSIWLHTIEKNKPLSFIDHHLKLGNSLVGADVDCLVNYSMTNNKDNNEQQNMFLIRLNEMLPIAVKEILGIIGRTTLSIADIEIKEKLLSAAKSRLMPFTSIANLWISSFFNIELHEQEYNQAVSLISHPKELLNLQKIRDANSLCSGNEHKKGEHFFHWQLEFPEIFYDEKGQARENPGFSAVIGNPPYVDVEAKGFYKRYQAASSTNLYAYFLERAFQYLLDGGIVGMIVPLSLVCSSRKKATRELFNKYAGFTRVASFSIRPSKIFPEADQRTSIVISRKSNKKFSLETSKYNRWYSGYEKNMMSSLRYITSTKLANELGWPKVGDKISIRILEKLFNKKSTIKNFLDGNVDFYYHSAARYWLEACTFLPFFKDEEGVIRTSTKWKKLETSKNQIRDLIVAIVNSSLFYFFWITYSDEFDLLKSEIESFPFEYEPDKYMHVYNMISRKVKELMEDYKKHSFIKEAKIKDTVKTWQEFKPGKSKPILDDIDRLLSGLYGLTDEETEYIIKYDENFRLGEN